MTDVETVRKTLHRAGMKAVFERVDTRVAFIHSLLEFDTTDHDERVHARETGRMTAPSVAVLLAENHPGDAELILESLGLGDLDGQVHLVVDGAAALDFLFHRGAYASRAGQPPPSLILLELDLPKVGGLDVLRAIKGSARTRSIPVVVFASSGLELDLVSCYRLGANSYVRKPGEFGAYREAVSRIARYWLGVNHPPPPRTFDGDGA